MDAEELTQARLPFGQAVRGRRRSQAGTGLGLPICISLVELLGGQLHLDSARDVGTTARVTLPWRAVAPDPEAAPGSARDAAPATAAAPSC
jgi:two-component system cell cycle sensor histidine kinase PleC